MPLQLTLPTISSEKAFPSEMLTKPSAVPFAWLLEELKQFNPLIDEDVYASLTLEGSLKARDHVGGTAPHQVAYQVERWKKILAERE